MKRLLLIILALLIPSTTAIAATANLSWVAPTEYTDGSPLNAADISGYKIFYEIDGDVTPASASAMVAPGVAAVLQISLTPRPEPYVVNFRAVTVLVDGRESGFSNIATKTFNVDSTANPNSPTNLTIEIVCGEGCTISEALTQ